MSDSLVPFLALGISTLSLGVSAVNVWWTTLRRGSVIATPPTLIAFEHEGDAPKIVVRTMLFNTAHRGNVIENMYANFIRENTTLTLAMWAYGETSPLRRGGGLFVGREGIAAFHHFTLLSPTYSHKFHPGKCTLQVFAKMLGVEQPSILSECSIELSEEMTGLLNNKSGAVWFNWNPNADSYSPDTRPHPKIELMVG